MTCGQSGQEYSLHVPIQRQPASHSGFHCASAGFGTLVLHALQVTVAAAAAATSAVVALMRGSVSAVLGAGPQRALENSAVTILRNLVPMR